MPSELREPLIAKAAEPFHASTSPPPKVLWNPLAWILWFLDFLVWLLTIVGPIKFISGLFKSRKSAVQIDDGIWRLKVAEDALLTTPDPACATVHDLLQKIFRRFATSPACGTRQYLGEHKPSWSKFPLQKFGETKWITYDELSQRICAFGSGLLQLGLRPATDVDVEKTSGPFVLLIFEDTCADWVTACIGAFSQSIVIATAYATLGPAAVAESINEVGAKAIVCNIKAVEKIAALGSKCPSLDTIIYTTNNSTEDAPKNVPSTHKVLSMRAVIGLGTTHPTEFTPPKSETLAVIMYTSGSTGKPKGVMIKHRCLVASIAGMERNFLDLGLSKGGETYLAYLPAAHILELVAELSCLALGSAIGFADPKTISSKGACRVTPTGELNTRPGYPYPAGAIQEFRPTLMAAVPKIWDILKKGVEEVVGKGSPVTKMLFQTAFSGRHWALSQGRQSPLFEKLVFQKLSDMLGGRLKAGFTGGGPISADVQNFIRTAFAIPLLQGYALTETTCAGTLQDITDVRSGVVGPPLGSIEIKLRSCFNDKGEPEILDRQMKPYQASDKKHYDLCCEGRGEILLRGPSRSDGYFKNKDKTDEVYDVDGWFHTGDVGVVLPDGAIMIVDRIKNLVKLKGGEYIALESMEKEYSASVYVNSVNGGILCYGDGDMDRPVALVQANTGELEKWANGSGISYETVEALCQSPAAQKMVLDVLVSIAKASGLGANEVLCAIALIPGTGPNAGTLTPESPWTPENAGLTASNKLNRQPILKGCDKILQPLKTKGIR